MNFPSTRAITENRLIDQKTLYRRMQLSIDAVIRQFIHEVRGEQYLYAVYGCTPWVRFPLASLKDGAHVRGETIGQFGYTPDTRQSDSMAEFDLILARLGKWNPKASMIPEAGHWFEQQCDALSIPFGHLSRDHGGATVRIHNERGEVADPRKYLKMGLK